MTPVIGVDGCPGGWIALRWAEDLTHHLCPAFSDVLALDGAIVAVDMPIGFQDHGSRAPEKLVRAKLGDRQSSVFAVPVRDAVMCETYAEACAANQRATDPPKKISKQIFHLFPKMREIDAVITPALQSRIHEVHPELAFWAMNGFTALTLPKKVKSQPHPPGLDLRRNLLAEAGFPFHRLPPVSYRRAEVGADDMLDACACAWSARRIFDGCSLRFPPEPPRDAKGLRMAIAA